jgi:endonuclease/exonuclease/phosphatase family metal-dependent hydrolase
MRKNGRRGRQGKGIHQAANEPSVTTADTPTGDDDMGVIDDGSGDMEAADTRAPDVSSLASRARVHAYDGGDASTDTGDMSTGDEKKEVVPKLNVMSWNMQKKSGEEINTDAALEMIAANKVDVVCVQEPPVGLKRRSGTTSRAGYNVTYDPDADCAIITRPGLVCETSQLFPRVQGMGTRRAVMIADVTDEEGHTMRIATVHAPYDDAAAAGPYMAQVFKELPKLSPKVHMLLGDTNLYGTGSGQRGGSRSSGQRMDGFGQLELPPTSNRGKGSPLDQIFVRSDLTPSGYGRVLPDRAPPVRPVSLASGSEDWQVSDRMGIIARPDHLPVHASFGSSSDDTPSSAPMDDTPTPKTDQELSAAEINAEIEQINARKSSGTWLPSDASRLPVLRALKKLAS